MQQAYELEKQILEYRPPEQSQISDTGNSRTPVSYLLQIAQIYRLGVLSQLYQSYTELLEVGFAGIVHYNTRSNTLVKQLYYFSKTRLGATPLKDIDIIRKAFPGCIQPYT